MSVSHFILESYFSWEQDTHRYLGCCRFFCIAREYKFFVIIPVAEMPTSGDLKSGNFFRSSTPRPNSPMRPPPPKKFLIYFYSLPPPPPISPRNFAGKTWISLCQGLQVVEYSSNQTLDYIGVTKKKVSFFCLQRATCMTQENEARNRNTSIRSQMISEFILEYMEFKS